MESLFDKVEGETTTQDFSCKICKIFKNTHFEEHLRTTASGKNCSKRFRKIHIKAPLSEAFLIKLLTYNVGSTVESNSVTGLNESNKNIVDIRDYKERAIPVFLDSTLLSISFGIFLFDRV